jgi:serralysin
MGYLRHLVTLGDDVLPHAWGIRDIEVAWFDNRPYVFAGAMADGGVNRLELFAEQYATLVEARPVSAGAATMGLSDLAVIELGGQPYLIATGRYAETPVLRELAPGDGGMGASASFDAPAAELRGWSQVTAAHLDGTDFLVVARHGEAGLWLYEVGPGLRLIARGLVEDTGKATLGGISDLATVVIDGTTFIVAASDTDSGITTLRLHADGRLEMIDMYGAALGVGMARSTALTTVEVQGETYVVVASAGTGTLTVLRINERGVLFETDHVWDNQHMRFGGVQDVASFSHDGRSFIVAGGNDDGLSLFEIGPGGRLYHLQSIEQKLGWTLGNVQAIGVTVIGETAVVLVAGENGAGLTQFRIDLTRFGELIMAGPGDTDLSGTARDDHLEAGGEDVILRGGAGDDRLVAGTGETRMWGGPGADVFVFRPGGGIDRIMDFEPGVDRIDLSAYPMVYSVQGLSFEPTHTGARIRVGDDVIVVRTADLQPLEAGDFAEADFIFG